MAKGTRSAGGRSARGARKRRGQGEEFTEAKANSVETRQATGSLALPKPDDWDYHKKQILGYIDQKESAAARVRNAIKAAKKAGIDTEQLLAAHQLVRENDPVKARRRFEQLAFALNQEGFPIHITVQDTLIADTLDGAEARGYADATENRHANNDYPEGSDMSKRYARGYAHGTAVNAKMSEEDIAKALADFDAEHGIGATSAVSEKWNQAADQLTQQPAAGSA